MAWVKLDDGFPRHRRVQELGRDTVAKWLHVTALCYCSEHLTDGLVDAVALRTIIATADVTPAAAKRAIPKLLKAGLWVQHEARQAWVIRDYHDYNPTAAEVKERRRVRSEAGQLGGIRSGESRRSKAKANGEANASWDALRVVEPPTPSPTQSSLNAL